MGTLSFNQLRYGRFNSRLLRKCLSCYFREGVAYRVRFGPIRGMKLYYDRSVNFHAILGLWDAEEYAFLQRVLTIGGFLRDRVVVADVGANLGMFSLWSTRLLHGRDHRVFAFEPAPDTLRMLHENVAINRIATIDVVPAACADREGTTEFFIGFHHHVSSLLEDWAHAEAPVKGTVPFTGRFRTMSATTACKGDSPLYRPEATSVMVPTTTLDAFFAARQESPDLIKMDIEGGGIFALKGCAGILAAKRPLLWIESHTPAEDRAISEALAAHDYCAYRFTDRRPVVHPDSTHPDPDGVWGTLLLYPREQYRRVAEAL
jgi:FkbM family methyltransferase